MITKLEKILEEKNTSLILDINVEKSKKVFKDLKLTKENSNNKWASIETYVDFKSEDFGYVNDIHYYSVGTPLNLSTRT